MITAFTLCKGKWRHTRECRGKEVCGRDADARRIAQQSRHVGMACVDMCVSLLLFAEVEQFGYEAAQLVAVAVDACQLVARVACARYLLDERVGETYDYRERSAYLVRHVEEEAQLRLVLFLDVAYTLLFMNEVFTSRAFFVSLYASAISSFAFFNWRLPRIRVTIQMTSNTITTKAAAIRVQ